MTLVLSQLETHGGCLAKGFSSWPSPAAETVLHETQVILAGFMLGAKVPGQPHSLQIQGDMDRGSPVTLGCWRRCMAAARTYCRLALQRATLEMFLVRFLEARFSKRSGKSFYTGSCTGRGLAMFHDITQLLPHVIMIGERAAGSWNALPLQQPKPHNARCQKT